MTIQRFKEISQRIRQHRYGFMLFTYLLAAAITGAGCVVFMWAFEAVLAHRLDFARIGWWCFLTTPALFLLSVELIRRFAPQAEGAGIPQVVYASQNIQPSNEKALLPLVTPRTFVIKVIALLLGLWAGASTGREGPTVHIAACLFFTLMLLFRKWFKINFDPKSAVVAGGAAGLAAAFNTPLAGVTFAIEELSGDQFSSIKDYVLMAIIFASLTAIALTGDYTYFGKLSDPVRLPFFAVLVIGIVGGAFGSFFSTALVKGTQFFSRHRDGKLRYALPMGLSLVVIVLGLLGGSDVLGPGNLFARSLVHGEIRTDIVSFPFIKLAATLLTYWSGIAGGIFAPCLAIGSSIGASLGSWMGVSMASCALLGMAAFLSGTIQAPMTAFVIIFEMTGHHQMLVPVMLASLLAFIVSRLLKTKHLYQSLALQYSNLLDTSPTS